MNITYEIEDGASLAMALEGLPKAVARGAALAALKLAGAPILAAVKAGIHSDTGLLMAGTRLRPARGDRGGRIAVLISAWARRDRVDAMKPYLHVAAGRGEDRYKVYYGRFVEFGHRVGRGANAENVVGERPFMRPGFDATEEAAATALEEALGNGIDQAFAQNAS